MEMMEEKLEVNSRVFQDKFTAVRECSGSVLF